jgi:CubicO group peptidase (beta-lactamase class C family)
VTKSVVSILFGLAMSHGAIKSLDQPVLDYFPEYQDLRTPERMKIRLRDLLSMTSGLHWDERTFPYTDPHNSEIAMDMATDRYRHILSEPIDHPPGQTWTYSGGDVALIAAVIARATGKPIEVFAEQALFRPLGITRFEWLKDDKGVPYAASGLRLLPHDMARIGQMMLQQGRWNGMQVVPKDWVEQSTTFKAQISQDRACGNQYGYYWWLGALCEDGRRTPYFMANGNGGQYIWVIPELDIVAVATAGFYDHDDGASSRSLMAVIKAAGGGPPPGVKR